jgi:hypothetical protein
MSKTEDQIKEIIQSEVKGDFTISTNLHGVDLKKCLVEPYLETLEDSFNEGQTVQMYVVLKEHPDSEEGYQIVYDPKENMFGLSIQGKGRDRVFLGYDGTFLESLQGM